jgi:hypothetical protein
MANDSRSGFRAATAAALLAGAVLAFSAPAQALSVTLTWTGSSGVGVVGGSSIEVAPGDTLTADVVIEFGATGLHTAAVSIGWDPSALTFLSLAGGSECPSPPGAASGTCTAGDAVSFSSLATIVPGVTVTGSSASSLDITGGAGNGLAGPNFTTIGQLVFDASGAPSVTAASVFYMPGLDGILDGSGTLVADSANPIGLGAPLAITASAQPQTKAQQACAHTLHTGLAKIAQTADKAVAACLKGAAKTGASAAACLAAPSDKVTKARAKLAFLEAKKCTEPPDFGATDATTVGDAAAAAPVNITTDVYGANPDPALATLAGDKLAAKCQQAVSKGLGKCLVTQVKEFARCAKLGLKKETILNGEDLDACLGDDPKGKIAKFCDGTIGKLAVKTLPKLCVAKGVDLSDAFPGCGSDDPADVAVCLEEITACRTCQAAVVADDLSVDCDLYDDGLANGSCW